MRHASPPSMVWFYDMDALRSPAGVTRHAARALGLKDRGVLAPGMQADFVLWDVKHPASLAYAMGANPLRATVFKGQLR